MNTLFVLVDVVSCLCLAAISEQLLIKSFFEQMFNADSGKLIFTNPSPRFAVCRSHESAAPSKKQQMNYTRKHKPRNETETHWERGKPKHIYGVVVLGIYYTFLDME